MIYTDRNARSRDNPSSNTPTKPTLTCRPPAGSILKDSKSLSSSDERKASNSEVLMGVIDVWWYASNSPICLNKAHQDSLQIWTSARRRSHHTAWPFLTTVAPPSHPISHVSSSANLAMTSTLAPSIEHQSLLHSSSSTSDLSAAHERKHRDSHHSTQPRVKVIEKPQMSEINPGVWDGMTPEQVRRFFPDEWERFVRDPYAYRAPRAESYHDLCGTFFSFVEPSPCCSFPC